MLTWTMKFRVREIFKACLDPENILLLAKHLTKKRFSEAPPSSSDNSGKESHLTSILSDCM